jgi:hypothetical protein
MGLTKEKGKEKEQDQRPRDWGYMAGFRRKDLLPLHNMVAQIRKTHNTDMIEDINDRFERKTDSLANGIQIQSVTKTEDLVVNLGLQQCINIILGASSARWTHMSLAMSSAAFTPSVTDTALNAAAGGPFFIPMSTYGWMEPRGMKLFFGAIGSPDGNGIVGTNDIREMGVYNGPSTADTLLNRENFFNNRPVRTITGDVTMYTSVFIFSSVIEFCPVA